MRRIRVTLGCLADRYADKQTERIVEFLDPETQLGGLISFRRISGNLDINVYREDEGVRVYAKTPAPTLHDRLAELYAQADQDDPANEHPLSGADFVDAVGQLLGEVES